MIKTTAHITQDTYKTELKSSSGNTLISDEPIDKGGKDLGFSPKELLTAALAACTTITLRMYADHKQWDLKEVNIEVELRRDENDNTKTIITRKMEFIGNLDEEQRTRLIQIANSCPVHKILANPIELITAVVKNNK